MYAGKARTAAWLAAAGLGCFMAITGGASAVAGPNERIVGGGEADPADWPFIAALVTRHGDQFCGGSVIARDAVVTAAHCVYGSRRRDVRVVTGRPDLRDDSVGNTVRVSGISVHQQYGRRGYRDVAVLSLAHATAAPVALLPSASEAVTETVPGSELRVAGWGGTKPNGERPSDVLLDVSVFAISDEECDKHFSYFRPDEEVCAYGEPQGGDRYNDSCYGDSGGPLVADSPRGTLLVGLVSYGGSLCGVKEPGVYAEVGRNLNFIQRKAKLP